MPKYSRREGKSQWTGQKRRRGEKRQIAIEWEPDRDILKFCLCVYG